MEIIKREELDLKPLEEALAEMTHRAKDVEEQLLSDRPDLLDLFRIYQNEAMVARRSLDNSLKELKLGAHILEVGGGVLALAIQLSSEGFNITTVEPIGEGFIGTSYLMSLFLKVAEKEELDLKLIESRIEECKLANKYDFIFSINVMEHLTDPYSVLGQLVGALNAGGKYRFFCPNYDFPYEPHFGKFLYCRNANSFVMSRKRAVHESYLDPLGLYNSINWITVRKIRKISKKCNYKTDFNQLALYDLLKRAINDDLIRKRHPLLTFIFWPIIFLRMDKLALLVPVEMQPILDATVSA